MKSKCYIDRYGNKTWKNYKRKLHRTDGPALEWGDVHKEWWVDGKRHREDGPAVINHDGYQEWYLNGKRQMPPTEELAEQNRQVFIKNPLRLKSYIFDE